MRRREGGGSGVREGEVRKLEKRKRWVGGGLRGRCYV